MSKFLSPSNPARFSLTVLFTLYLAQGLPVGFMTQALPTLLRHYGVSLSQISASGLLMMPWAIKFLWAPYVDRYGYTRFGHYRTWILCTQLLMIICLIGLAFLPIAQLQDISTLWGLFIVLFILNVLCATQDIATDGMAVNILKTSQVQWGNTFQVMGSRLGFILGGGAVLYSIDILSWQLTFILLALGVLLNSIAIVCYQEPYQRPEFRKNPIRITLRAKLFQLYGHLWSSRELKIWLSVLLTYKIADGLAGPLLKPMMVDAGLTLTQIGVHVTMFGAGCAVVGALLGGWLIKRYGLAFMFIVFSIFQSLSFLYYVLLAYFFEQKMSFSIWHLYLANALEEFFSAMSLVAMLSLIMLYSREKFAGTDFTVQVALMATMGGILYLMSGYLAELYGYYIVLSGIFLISVLCLIPRLYWLKCR